MQFASPEMGIWFLLVPLYWGLLWWTRRARQARLAQLVSLVLQPRLVMSPSSNRRFLKIFLVSLGLSLAALAAMRPQIGLRIEKIEQEGLDLCLAVDVSRSMLATDVSPNRLQVAKQEIRKLLDSLEGDRVALVAFAGGAFVQFPLTLDYGTARLFLDVLDSSLIPSSGTNLAAALQVAQEQVFEEGEGEKVLILLTDGEDHSGKFLEQAQLARNAGIRIYTIGLGSPLGAPLPAAGGETGNYQKDKEGQIVLSRLNIDALQQVAEMTGGRYYHVEVGKSPLAAVFKEISSLEGRKQQELLRTVYEEEFPWLLLFAFLALALDSVLGICSPGSQLDSREVVG